MEVAYYCVSVSWTFLYPGILQKFAFLNIRAERVFLMDSDRIMEGCATFWSNSSVAKLRAIRR